MSFCGLYRLYIKPHAYRKYTVTGGGQCTNADVSGFRCVNVELGCVFWYVDDIDVKHLCYT